MTVTDFFIAAIGVVVVVIFILDVYPQLTVRPDYKSPALKKKRVKIKKVDNS